MTPQERAKSIIQDVLRRSNGEFEIAEHIRLAIWAEREACARIAREASCEYALAHPGVCCGHPNDGEHEAASRIAAAIRARSE